VVLDQVRPGEVGAGFVEEVPSRAPHLRVLAGELHRGFGPVRRPWLFAGEDPLVTLQWLLAPFPVFGVWEAFAVGAS